MIVACVMTGNKYSFEDVYKLQYMLSQHTTIGYEFICITDQKAPGDITTVSLPLNNDIDGWWNKLYLFNTDIFPKDIHICYLDLDVVIQRSIDEFLITTNYDDLRLVEPIWKMRENVTLSPILSKESRCNSSIMTFRAGQHSNIWDHFNTDKNYFMSVYHGIDRFLTCEDLDFKFIENLRVYSHMYGKDPNEKRSKRYCYYPDYDVCLLNNMKDIAFETNYNKLFNTLYPSYHLHNV